MWRTIYRAAPAFRLACRSSRKAAMNPGPAQFIVRHIARTKRFA
jgi:hypothetical protein